MKKLLLLLSSIALAIIIVTPSFAKPPMALPHRSTWDSDMINVEAVFAQGYTGKGVYIAVLDTGLVPNWRDYFPVDRIATDLGKGFWEPVHVDPLTGELVYAGFVEETSWVGSLGEGGSHGTHVTSTIIGYNYYAPSDAAAGLPLPPLFIEGIAPSVTIIPIKVLTTYNLPPYTGPEGVVFGTDLAVAAGIYYATELKIKGYSPMIISMSIGGPEPSTILEASIDYAIANGVIVVAAAGNNGLEGMDWPGAYPEVISAGANGWRYEWYRPTAGPHYRLWWLQDTTYGYRDIPEPTPATDVYVTDWSSRENDSRVPGYDQELDVLAPGSWVRGPLPGYPGYNHLPWWAPGMGWIVAPPNLVNFYYVGGTSMSTPHVSAVAALMLEKNPSLNQATIESIMKSTALTIPYETSMVIWDRIDTPPYWGWVTVSWGGAEATGSGLIQADAAVTATPSP
jgi:subtilisin family serine protease